MVLFARLMAIGIVICLLVGGLAFWYRMFLMGNLYLNADMMVTLFGFLLPIGSIVGAGFLCNFIWRADAATFSE